MLSTTSVLQKLKANYPQFSFKQGDSFMWSPSENTIYYDDTADNQPIFLLHELSHAILGHASYDRDIQLVAMERQAWDYTANLAPTYDIEIPADIIQTNLDSYRDWIHERSTCVSCKATGIQTDKSDYSCPACNHKWRVNDARTCALRRYKLIKQ